MAFYSGNYGGPLGQFDPRPMMQAASAQAQMYQNLGSQFGNVISKYFKKKEETKMVESMAENPIALQVVYGDQGTVPTDQKDRVKDMRGIVRASGGPEAFMARMDNAELKTQNKQLSDLTLSLKTQQLEANLIAMADAAKKREGEEAFLEWFTTPPPRRSDAEVRQEILAPRSLPPSFGPEPARRTAGEPVPPGPVVNAVTGEVIGRPPPAEAPMNLSSSAAFREQLAGSGMGPRPTMMGMEYGQDIQAAEQAAARAEQAAARPEQDLQREMRLAKYKKELEAPTGPKDTSGSDVTNNALRRAMGKISGWTTSAGGILKKIPGSDARALSNLLDTVKANIGFDKLQAMRKASPTGGALGQVSERELDFLQGVFGSLDQYGSAEDLTYNLKLLQHVYNNLIHGEGNHSYRHPDAGGGGADSSDFEFGDPVRLSQ